MVSLGLEAEKAHIRARQSQLLADLQSAGLINVSLLDKMNDALFNSMLVGLIFKGEDGELHKALCRSAEAIAKVRGDDVTLGMFHRSIVGPSAKDMKNVTEYLEGVLQEYKERQAGGSALPESTRFRDMVVQTKSSGRDGPA